NNSSCSLREGVMCALTCAVRFSRVMVSTEEKRRRYSTGESPRTARRGLGAWSRGRMISSTAQGGGYAISDLSFCPSRWLRIYGNSASTNGGRDAGQGCGVLAKRAVAMQRLRTQGRNVGVQELRHASGHDEQAAGGSSEANADPAV